MSADADVARSPISGQGRLTSFGIPGREDSASASRVSRDVERSSPVFRGKEVLAVSQDHVLHARLEHDRAHGPLLARAVPSPAAVRPARRRSACACAQGRKRGISAGRVGAGRVQGRVE